MASLFDLPVVRQPYPDDNPWYDVSSYLVNDWGGFVFWAKVSGNDAHIYLRCRYGTHRTITETLPDEILPLSSRIFDSFVTVEGNVGVLMSSSGKMEVYAPSVGYDRLIDGTLLNLVVDSSYARTDRL